MKENFINPLWDWERVCEPTSVRWLARLTSNLEVYGGQFGGDFDTGPVTLRWNGKEERKEEEESPNLVDNGHRYIVYMYNNLQYRIRGLIWH